MVISSVSTPHLVSVTSSMGVLFPPSKMDRSIHTMVFLLFEFHVVCELYLGYSELLGFWANIHLSVNAYHMCSFVIGLPRSGGSFKSNFGEIFFYEIKPRKMVQQVVILAF